MAEPYTSWWRKAVAKEIMHVYPQGCFPISAVLRPVEGDQLYDIDSVVLVDTPERFDELIRGMLTPEPITVDRLIADAARSSYTEVYAIYRRRERPTGDRLPESLLTAPTLEQAIGKLLLISGLDEAEIEAHGLRQFDAGNIMELCERLQELTGDIFEVCPYEQPEEH